LSRNAASDPSASPDLEQARKDYYDGALQGPINNCDGLLSDQSRVICEAVHDAVTGNCHGPDPQQFLVCDAVQSAFYDTPRCDIPDSDQGKLVCNAVGSALIDQGRCDIPTTALGKVICESFLKAEFKRPEGR
jgi:hypothetical protein